MTQPTPPTTSAIESSKEKIKRAIKYYKNGDSRSAMVPTMYAVLELCNQHDELEKRFNDLKSRALTFDPDFEVRPKPAPPLTLSEPAEEFSETAPKEKIVKCPACGGEMRLWKGHNSWEVWHRCSTCELETATSLAVPQEPSSPKPLWEVGQGFRSTLSGYGFEHEIWTVETTNKDHWVSCFDTKKKSFVPPMPYETIQKLESALDDGELVTVEKSKCHCDLINSGDAYGICSKCGGFISPVPPAPDSRKAVEVDWIVEKLNEHARQHAAELQEKLDFHIAGNEAVENACWKRPHNPAYTLANTVAELQKENERLNQQLRLFTIT